MKDGIHCDDGDPCTIDDKCVNGACQGTPKCVPSCPCETSQCDAGKCVIKEKCISTIPCISESCDSRTGDCKKKDLCPWPQKCDEASGKCVEPTP